MKFSGIHTFGNKLPDFIVIQIFGAEREEKRLLFIYIQVNRIFGMPYTVNGFPGIGSGRSGLLRMKILDAIGIIEQFNGVNVTGRIQVHFFNLFLDGFIKVTEIIISTNVKPFLIISPCYD